MFEFEQKVVTASSGDNYLSLIISGAVGVESIAKLKELLLDGFSQHDHIRINLQQITAADFTLVQLLCATNKYAQRNHKLFSVAQSGSELLENAATLLGFVQCESCVDALDPQRCLWIADNV